MERFWCDMFTYDANKHLTTKAIFIDYISTVLLIL